MVAAVLGLSNSCIAFQVTAPEPFNLSRPEEWEKGVRCFERFKKTSGLEEKGEEAQVNTLIYSMDDEADAYDILCSFSLSVEEQKSYATVKAKFDSHFTKRQKLMLSSSVPSSICADRKRVSPLTPLSRLSTPSPSTVAMACSTMK